MLKKWLVFNIVLLLLINSYTPINASVFECKNILIINSYHKGFQWTDDQTTGFLEALESMDTDVSIEYLDWKRYPSEQNLKYLYASMKLKYEEKKIDLIYCTDDAAFSFAMTYRKEIFSDAPIVFSGINADSLEKLGNQKENYTGVIEKINPENTIRTALNIQPGIKNIYLIYDNTESGLSTGALCAGFIEEHFPDKNVFLLNQLNRYEIMDTVSAIDPDSMVLVTTYFKDTDGTIIDHNQYCESLYAVSSVPIYHLYDFGMGEGVLGGDLLRGTVQGEEVAKLAIRVLNQEDINSIPIVECNSESYVFDYQVMMSFNISKSNLPKDSVLINEPFSFTRTYRTLIYIVLGVFTLLILFKIFLLYHIRKIRGMRRDLLNSNQELSGLYEELSASEMELRTKYSEIAISKEQLEESSKKLLFQAYHNDLTGLFNRRYLYEVLKNEFVSSNQAAFLFIDLDNFSYMNDVIGHANGDLLLRQIGGRLSSLRNPEAELIHWSGDEFVFVLKFIKNRQDVNAFVDQIMQAFETPFTVEKHSFTIRLSIGISLCPEHGSDLSTLISNADLAMFKVKTNGKNNHYFFDEVIRAELTKRVNTENSLQSALDRNEFFLYYQPQVNQLTNEIKGFEALIRWKSSEYGFMPPDQFIPIAEENGFISILGEWVLLTACRFINNLNQRMNKQFNVSVNISVIQIINDDFIDVVKNALKESELSPEFLELEITESTIMKSTDIVVEKIKELRALGIDIALDDFGTGYSSMSHLRNIPLSTVKIDKTFMKDIPNSIDNTNIIEIIMDLGQKFNLDVVAEGVEQEEQLQFLRGIGCEIIQGYLYSKPLPEDEIDDLVARLSTVRNI